MRANVLRSSIVLAFTVMVSGCLIPGQFSGGGKIPSASGNAGDKATFTFSGDSCTPDVLTGSLNYIDKKAPDFASQGGVKIKSTDIIAAGECSSEAPTEDDPCGVCGCFAGCLLETSDEAACAAECGNSFPFIPGVTHAAHFDFRSTNPAL